MKHSEVRRDITDSNYIQVKDDDFSGQFRWTHSSVHEGACLLPSAMTLRKAPTGWIDRAEEYLEDEGFTVI